MDQDVAASDWNIVSHDLAAAFAVHWPNAGVEDREVEFHDLFAVANETVADASDRAAFSATVLISSPQGAFVMLVSLECTATSSG